MAFNNSKRIDSCEEDWGRLSFPLIICFVLMFVVKQALIGGLPVYAINSAMDDAWMVDNGLRIIEGDWLGDFEYLTIVKPPLFPLFLALSNTIGLSYVLSQNIFYWISCLLVVSSIKPILNGNVKRCIVFMLLYFIPVMLAHDVIIRVYRNGIAPALALFSLAAFFGQYFHRHSKLSKYALYCILSGIGLAGLRMLRDDYIWIWPFFIGFAMIILINLAQTYLKNDVSTFLKKSILTLVPVIILCVFNILISYINYNHYGIFKVTGHPDSYTKMCRTILQIKPEKELARVSLTSDMLEKALQESPTLNKIREHMEYRLSYFDSVDSVQDGEVEGGWTGQLIGGSLSAGGYFDNIKVLTEFCEKVTVELEAAFANGALTKKVNDQPNIPIIGHRGVNLSLLYSNFLNSLSFVVNYMQCELPNVHSASIYNKDKVERITLHRTNSTAYHYIMIGGVFSHDDADDVQVCFAKGDEIVGIAARSPGRPDIAAAYPHLENAKMARWSIELQGDYFNQSGDYSLVVLLNGDEVSRRPVTDRLVHESWGSNQYTVTLDNLVALPIASIKYLESQPIPRIISLYQQIGTILFYGCILLYAAMTILVATNFFTLRTKIYDSWLVMTGLLFSGLIIILGIALTTTLDFDAITIPYLSQAYPLLLLFELVAVFTAWSIIPKPSIPKIQFMRRSP